MNSKIAKGPHRTPRMIALRHLRTMQATLVELIRPLTQPRTEQVRVEDTRDIYFEQGALVIKKKDAREGLFSSEGVFRFPVSQMNDFQVFLVVLEEQTGIRFR